MKATDAVCCDQLVKRHNTSQGDVLALKMEIKLTSNVNVKTKGVKRILKLHFYMHVLHVVKIRSYIEESFTE